jgi:asparagine synthetase B (glutamine-hydrolysing)
MCRIGVVIGPNARHLGIKLAELQKYGGNHPPELWSGSTCALMHNRFDVTSSDYGDGTFPLETDNFVLHFNGEVYGWMNDDFKSAKEKSDSHFAMRVIESVGVEAFLKDVDFQGSYQIYDKKNKLTYIAVDQLNTAGYFYTVHGDSFIGASEHSAVHSVLSELGAPSDTPINIIKNGSFITVDEKLNVNSFEYRDSYKRVWSGQQFSIDDFKARVEILNQHLKKSVDLRIPESGEFGVLCSGGVDSSLILAYAVKVLREHGELERLKIFTFADEAKSVERDNDLFNVKVLLEALEIDADAFLQIISKEFVDNYKDRVYKETVFTESPFLVAPVPMLGAGSRHMVAMSLILGWIVNHNPAVKVILTGDCADEIFAGYNPMSQNIFSGNELKERVVQKLNDLPLNDASRVALSCFHGTRYVSENILGISNPRPVEVRQPFTSHKVLNVLEGCHPDYLIGKYRGEWSSKFILRNAALLAGVPEEIAFRKKLPFHEGATALRNSEFESREIEFAKLENTVFSADEVEQLKKLGIDPNSPGSAMYRVANRCGLQGLFAGNSFSDSMLGHVNSTDISGTEYLPSKPIEFTSL